MKDQRKTEIKVGITVLVAIIIFLWVLGWAKNFTVNSGRKIINVEFNSAAGLEAGDPVAVNGVRKGYVEDISIKNEKVFISVNLDSDIILKEDAKFSIMMLDLMGGKKVEVNPGFSANELDYSSLQKGETLGDIASAMAVFGNVQGDLIDVIKEVKVSLSYLNKTLSDEKFEADLKTSVNNLKVLTENLNSVLNANKNEINDLLKSGNQLTKSVNSFISENKDTIKQTISSLKETLNYSKTLIANINNFITKTDNGENNLGKVLNDKNMIEDLKTSIQNLKELSTLLLEQLKSKGLKVDADVSLF
jgi:phospholipid/cholesterol/gamma-HCH transport system substrate-binding protein